MVANGGTDASPRSRALRVGFAGRWRQCFVVNRIFKYYYLPNGTRNCSANVSPNLTAFLVIAKLQLSQFFVAFFYTYLNI
jgi:hypothetical protein